MSDFLSEIEAMGREIIRNEGIVVENYARDYARRLVRLEALGEDEREITRRNLYMCVIDLAVRQELHGSVAAEFMNEKLGALATQAAETQGVPVPPVRVLDAQGWSWRQHQLWAALDTRGRVPLPDSMFELMVWLHDGDDRIMHDLDVRVV